MSRERTVYNITTGEASIKPWLPHEEMAADAAYEAEVAAKAAALGDDNGEALDARRRETKKEEINSLIEKDDLSGALKLALELIP